VHPCRKRLKRARSRLVPFADHRGILSEIRELESRTWRYILGACMRKQKEVREEGEKGFRYAIAE
jgi:hypothetical protein